MTGDTARGPLATARRLSRDRTVRSIAIQAMVFVAVAGVIAFFVINTAHNLEARGITSGFGFLGQPAGYDVAMSLIPYENTNPHGKVFIVGVLNTLLVSFLGIVGCTVLGVVLGVLRMSGNWLVARLVMAYVEVMRNVPLLLQIFFWYSLTLYLPVVRDSISLFDAVYINRRGMSLPLAQFDSAFLITLAALVTGLVVTFVLRRLSRARTARGEEPLPVLAAGIVLIAGLPLLTLSLFGGMSWDVPEAGRFNIEGGFFVPQAFTGLFLALTLYTAAFVAEIVRGGIQSVDKGQLEAASALGLRPGLTMRLIVLPQALRVIVPPLTNQYLNLFKNSSLGVAIGYPELFATFGGTTLNQTGQAVEVLFICMLFYLSVSLIVSLLMNLYNQRIALAGAAR